MKIIFTKLIVLLIKEGKYINKKILKISQRINLSLSFFKMLFKINMKILKLIIRINSNAEAIELSDRLP